MSEAWGVEKDLESMRTTGLELAESSLYIVGAADFEVPRSAHLDDVQVAPTPHLRLYPGKFGRVPIEGGGCTSDAFLENAMPVTSDHQLRSQLVRLASTTPKGTPGRAELLQILAKFPADSIGEVVPGASGEAGSDAQKPWMKGEFTQQENMELDAKQESGEVGDGKADDGPMKVASADRPLYAGLVRLARDNPSARGPILAMLRDLGLLPKSAKKGEEDQQACGEEVMAGKKEAGCEKLPPALQKNCEKKQDEGEDKDKKEASLRASVIRLAHQNPAFRQRLLPLLQG